MVVGQRSNGKSWARKGRTMARIPGTIGLCLKCGKIKLRPQGKRVLPKCVSCGWRPWLPLYDCESCGHLSVWDDRAAGLITAFGVFGCSRCPNCGQPRRYGRFMVVFISILFILICPLGIIVYPAYWFTAQRRGRRLKDRLIPPDRSLDLEIEQIRNRGSVKPE